MKESKWYVGIDWGTEEHAVCLVADDGKVVGQRTFPHSGKGIATLVDWLLEKTSAHPSEILVAIETPHGAVVETLLERRMLVHSINPKQLDRFRDRFTVAGAKDDARDAQVLADSLRTDQKCFRVVAVDDPKVIELREWSRLHDELTEERVRLGNRVREQLLRYYPQILSLTDDVAAGWFLELWELMPSPKAARTARQKRVLMLLREHRIRRVDVEHVMQTLREKPLVVAPGTTEAATAHIASLVERIRIVNRQLKDTDRRIEQLTEELATRESDPGQTCEQRDVAVLRSLPGVGRIVLATLLTEASRPLRERDYHALRALFGVAPVTKRTGKQGKPGGSPPIILMRHACNHRLRNAAHNWGGIAIQRDPKSRAVYAALRARGHSHARALRTIVDRLLVVACAMLRAGCPFEPRRRLAA